MTLWKRTRTPRLIHWGFNSGRGSAHRERGQRAVADGGTERPCERVGVCRGGRFLGQDPSNGEKPYLSEEGDY